MRRISIATLASLAGAVTMGVSAAGAATNPVVGHYRSATDSAAAFPDYSWTANHEQVVDLQAWQTQELYALKAANPNITVLMYKNASSVSDSPDSSGRYATGVSYDEANANDWLLRNTSGSPFTFNGYSTLWASDIGSSGYQQAWASNVISELNSAPWDGVLIDDVNPTIKWHYCVTCVAKYPSDAQYGAAMQRFVQAVGPRIQADHKLAIANIGSWAGYESVADPWLRSLSGAEDEMFLKWGSVPGDGYADPTTWADQLGEVRLAASEGKLFIGITHSSNTDVRAAVYGYATELLAGNGDAVFYMGNDYTNETWFPEYNYALGSPQGGATQLSDGVYRRLFANGMALVNPTLSTQNVTLGGTYSGSGLTNVKAVRMGPQSGLVLTGRQQSRNVARIASAHKGRHRRHRLHMSVRERRHRHHALRCRRASHRSLRSGRACARRRIARRQAAARHRPSRGGARNR